MSIPNKSIKLPWDQAEAGDPAAQLVLGWALVRGQGVEADRAAGTQFLRNAASAGNKEAAFRLAFLRETEKDARCVADFRRLGTVGYSPALYELGNLYWSGFLVEINRRKAAAYYRRAAKLGHFLARARLKLLPAKEPFCSKFNIVKRVIVYLNIFAFLAWNIRSAVAQVGSSSMLGRT